MHIMTCYAGFPLPLKAGKCEILGVQAPILDTGAPSQLILWDDYSIDETAQYGNIYSSDDRTKKVQLVDLKGISNADGELSQVFPEPLKLRRGLSVMLSNISKVFVYVR